MQLLISCGGMERGGGCGENTLGGGRYFIDSISYRTFFFNPIWVGSKVHPYCANVLVIFWDNSNATTIISWWGCEQEEIEGASFLSCRLFMQPDAGEYCDCVAFWLPSSFFSVDIIILLDCFQICIMII